MNYLCWFVCKCLVLGLDLLVLLPRVCLFTHIPIAFVDMLLERYSNSPWFLCLMKCLSSVNWIAFVEYSVRLPCSWSSHIACWKRHTSYEICSLMTDRWVACHSCILSVSHAWNFRRRLLTIGWMVAGLRFHTGWCCKFSSQRSESLCSRSPWANEALPLRRTEMILHPLVAGVKLPSA